MILGRKDGPWAVFCAAALILAVVLYVPYHRSSLNGPAGGTLPGLAYGVAGFLALLFVGLLGLRKCFPAWRIGRTETWLRGHLWLGLLGAALIVLHSGFRFGGMLTASLMWLLALLSVSGVVGVVLQQVLPRMMTSQVKVETIYEQIDHVMAQLADEARAKVEAVCGALGDEAPAADGRPVRRISAEAEGDGVPVLKELYLREIRPYLAGARRGPRLSDARLVALVFADVRTRLPPSLHDSLGDLESICDEHRQLRAQKFLHHCLHGWLLVHVPLSYAFLVLTAVHVVYSVRY